MATFQFSNLDARLVYLALQYHLARPGSELNPETKRPLEHGLAEVARALEPQLEGAVATIELDDYQRRRLVSAVAGAVNELNTLPLLGGPQGTTVPAFRDALQRLFPEAGEEPDQASQLAGHLVAFRRRLERAGATQLAEERPEARRPWWRFWERRGA